MIKSMGFPTEAKLIKEGCLLEATMLDATLLGPQARAGGLGQVAVCWCC
jgi:hypothetical protein